MQRKRRLIAFMALVTFLAFAASGLWARETIWDKLRKHKRKNTFTGPDGKQHTGATDIERGSRGYKNEDGSLTIENEASAANEKWGIFKRMGKSRFGKTEGGHKWQSQQKVRHGENPWGWDTKTQGSSKKLKDGSTWNNEKVITDLKGRKTLVNKQGRWKDNGDGTWTHFVDTTRTLHDGKVLRESEETIFRKGKDGGLVWDKKLNKDGFFGKSSMSESGGLKFGKKGLKWNNQREGVNAQGKKWFSNSSGSGKKGENGTIWNRKTDGSTADGKFKWKWGNKRKANRDADGNVNVSNNFSGDVGGEKGKKFKEWLNKMKKQNKNKKPRKKWWKKK